MSLTRALNTAYSGLSSSSYRADIASNNIANANSPDYVRRNVVTAENTVGGKGNGVRIIGVDRAQDYELSRLRRDADAAAGRSEILASTYTQLNREIGAPGDAYGLFSAYENLESSLRDLAVTPESPALQNSVLSASREIVDQFNSLAVQNNERRVRADDNIARDVNTVNSALNRLHELNGDIASFRAGDGGAAALEDERQSLISTIAEIIPVKDIRREGGIVDIVSSEGVFLLSSGSVKPLEFTAVGAIGPTSDYATGVGNLSGLRVGNQDLTPGQTGSFSVSSGRLAGYFAVRDSVVPAFSAQLDSLAGDLITRVSQDAIDPTKTAGDPGLFTDAGLAFDPLNTVGAAGRLRLNAAVDPVQGGLTSRLRDGLGAVTEGPSGQAEILNGLLGALTSRTAAPTQTALNGNFSTSELIAGITSIIGENQVRNDALSAGATARANVLSDAEFQAGGVDTDNELQSLLLIEQSYAANARVIQTIGDMMDRLLQI